MDIATRNRRNTMLKKMLLAAFALTASSAALAHDGWRQNRDGWRDDHDGWRHEFRHHGYYRAPRAVYFVPAPRIVYAPPPPVAYPYYAAPVVVRPAPAYPAAPGVSIRFNFPL